MVRMRVLVFATTAMLGCQIAAASECPKVECPEPQQRWTDKDRRPEQEALLNILDHLATADLSHAPNDDTRFIDTPITQLAGASIELFKNYCRQLNGVYSGTLPRSLAEVERRKRERPAPEFVGQLDPKWHEWSEYVYGPHDPPSCSFPDLGARSRLIFGGRDMKSSTQIRLVLNGVPVDPVGQKYLRWFDRNLGRPHRWMDIPSARGPMVLSTSWNKPPFRYELNREYPVYDPGFMNITLYIERLSDHRALMRQFTPSD